MWHSETINIIICVCCLAFVRTEEICEQPYEPPKWESRESKFPADLRLGLVPGFAGALEAQIDKRRENFNLTLLANPFIKDENKCPAANSSYHNLRKFHMTRRIIKGADESESIFFSKIFTGCYYAEMTNAEGKKWLWDPVFFNTSYHYYDTMLKCKKFEVKPESYEMSRQLNYLIEIPLTCLQVRCQLFELDEETNNTKHDLDTGNTPATQDCRITNRGIGNLPFVKCRRTDTRPKLYAESAEMKGEGWETLITWKNLKEGGASYFTLFEQYNHTCNMDYGDLMTWVPVIKIGALVHGRRNEVDKPNGPGPPDFFHSQTFTIILYIVLGVSMTAILIYWTSKYARILIEKELKADNLYVLPQEIVQLNEDEPNQIVLIYARDSPPFMRSMDALRVHLQQISHFPVHDAYSINEWNMITKLGAMGWVEDLFRDGSKFVWVDTPQFRSVLKESKSNQDYEKQHIWDDFRDEAIPYSVTLAKNLFPNATTQYRRHFVVRLQGFEVEDEDGDPLLVVSPHMRYSIPEHLSLLCEHLAR